jgi:hypothetical protein
MRTILDLVYINALGKLMPKAKQALSFSKLRDLGQGVLLLKPFVGSVRKTMMFGGMEEGLMLSTASSMELTNSVATCEDIEKYKTSPTLLLVPILARMCDASPETL